MTCGFLIRSNRVKDNGEVGVISPSITEKDTRCSRLQADQSYASSSSSLRRLYGQYHVPNKESSSSCATRWQLFILNPRATFMQRWNMLFLIVNLFSIFIDPLFLLLPHVRPAQTCILFSPALKITLTVIRSIIDVFFMIHILLGFLTAYIAPSSRVTGRGELVKDHYKIARRYLRYGFWWDLAAAIPLPQVLIWLIMPKLLLGGSMISDLRTTYMMLIITVQMLHRSYQAYLLSSQLAMASGIMTEKAWVIAAYNLIFYLLASIVAGNWWYLLSIQRQQACWRNVCDQEEASSPACSYAYFDCSTIGSPSRDSWFRRSNVTVYCDPKNNYYEYGIYSSTVTQNISSGRFFNKFFYCIWWGIRNLSSQGQNLYTSIYVLENIFTIAIATLGVILFFFLIGNMQKYFQSATSRLEEWRMKQTDLEQWMHHRQLPKELTQSIRRYHKFEWKATQGVNEQVILNQLPANLRRQTKSYLCLNLLRQVPLFHQLDDRTLDAICERLKPALYPQDMYLLHEGYPVTEMLFIIRGHLYSYTTDGGRTGFFNSSKLSPNDFCGEELLTWALDYGPHRHHHDHIILPLSTRTIKTIANVEGFTLGVEDLRFISLQFRRIHSRDLHHKLRLYSQQWRTWAACFIQASWHVYKNRRKKGSSANDQLLLINNVNNEHHQYSLSNFPTTGAYEDMNMFVPRPDAGIEVYAARLMADVRRCASNRFQ